MSSVPAKVLGWTSVPFGRASNPKYLPHANLEALHSDHIEGVYDVQEWVNKNIEYTSDGANRDHWQTPKETLARGRGDCEDMALLKMAYLIGLGHTPSLLLCKDRMSGGEWHAVALTKHLLFDLRGDPRRLDVIPGEPLRPIILYCGHERYLMGREIER